MWETPWVHAILNRTGQGNDLELEFHKTRPPGEHVYRLTFDENYEEALLEIPAHRAW